MGYTLSLVDEKTKQVGIVKTDLGLGGSNLSSTIPSPHQETFLTITVTYNYLEILQEVLGKKGIRSIYGIKAKYAIPILIEAITKLDNNFTSDYWVATEGNVKLILLDILKMSLIYTDGVWEGD